MRRGVLWVVEERIGCGPAAKKEAWRWYSVSDTREQAMDDKKAALEHNPSDYYRVVQYIRRVSR